MARKEAKVKGEVAHVGRVARQDTLQRGVELEATTICTPLMMMTVETLKKQLTMWEIGEREPEHVERMTTQATVLRGVEKVATQIWTLLMRMTVKTLKKQLTMKKTCKMNSGKR